MKKTKVLTTVLLILIVTLLQFTGCSTTPKTGITYSFAEDNDPLATISFGGDSSSGYTGFINYNGAELPKPEENTYWRRDEIVFPAEEPLALTVRAKYDGAPIPMLSAAEAFFAVGNFFMEGAIFEVGDPFLGTLYFLFIGLPAFALALASYSISLPFLALALVIDLPIALAINFDKKVAFDCPPLDADRSYALKLERKKPRRLVLVDTGTDTVVFEYAF